MYMYAYITRYVFQLQFCLICIIFLILNYALLLDIIIFLGGG